MIENAKSTKQFIFSRLSKKTTDSYTKKISLFPTAAGDIFFYRII